MKQRLKLNSVKKHSVRYDASAEPTIVTSIYIMKGALPSTPPKFIILEIEADE